MLVKGGPGASEVALKDMNTIGPYLSTTQQNKIEQIMNSMHNSWDILYFTPGGISNE